MRINCSCPNQGFQKTSPTVPFMVHEHIVPIVIIEDKDSDEVLENDLIYLASLNRFYHGEIGVYNTRGGLLWG